MNFNLLDARLVLPAYLWHAVYIEHNELLVPLMFEKKPFDNSHRTHIFDLRLRVYSY